MAFTGKNIVPIVDGGAGLGSVTKGWGGAFITNVTASSATEGGKLVLAANDGAVMASGHRLGVIEFKGAEDTSSTLTIGARIEALADATWSASENGASLKMYTTDANASESLVLTLDSDKLATFTGAVTVTGALTGTLATASQPNVTTLAGLTSFGSAGATTNILAGDLRMFNAVNDGNPSFVIGKDANEAFMIQSVYDSGAQTLDYVEFKSFAASGTANKGKFIFTTDESPRLTIDDGGIDFAGNMGISINGTDILTDSSGTATLSNIDALDATTIATIETAVEANIDTLNGSITIDTDRSTAQGNAGAEDITALHVDFDRIVPSSGTYAHNDIGIDLDVHSASLGTSSLRGMDIDVVGETSGTSTAYGIDLSVDAADTSIGMQINTRGTHLKLVSGSDADDYATFTVAPTGDLTIATAGDGTTDSDLILDADGKIQFQPAEGRVVSVKSTKASAADAGGLLSLISDDGAALGDDHRLGKIGFQAAEDSSSTIRQGASIEAFADAAWSASENGTRLEFYTMDGNNVSEKSLTLDSDKQATFAGAVTVTGALTGTLATVSQPNVTTLAGVTTIGATGVNLVINHDDIQWYNPVNNGSPSFQIGASATEHFKIQAGYITDTQEISYMQFNSITASSVANRGKFRFTVDGTNILHIDDDGIDLYTGKGIAINGTDILTDSSGTATLSNIDALDATTVATIQAAATHSQIINLKGYCVLEDDNYLFAEDFTDAQAPWQLAQDYTSGTIGSGTEVAQTLFMKAGGFHVPVACVMNSIQVQAAVNGSGGGNITVAVVEYRPSEHVDDRDDYPRTVYEEVVVASNNNASKIKTVSVASGALDNTAIPAGSHLLIMVKGDGDTDGDTAQVSVAIEIRW